tara:strand:- start:100 stop:591 length:492 start_codon:yes stop_codon:yes gene_type:complete
MASLRLTKSGSWFAKMQWWNGVSRKEKYVSLKIKSKVTARERIAEVNKVEDDFKQGMEFFFPWLDGTIETKVKRFTLKDAVDHWMSKREGNLADKTIELNRDGLSYFLIFFGSAYLLGSITTNQMEKFSDWLDGKGLSKNSINIHLRTIKAMFRYFLKVDKLT